MQYIFQTIQFEANKCPICPICGSSFTTKENNAIITILKCSNNCSFNRKSMSHQRKKSLILPKDIYNEYLKTSSSFYWEYWVLKGYSEDEAKEIVKTNSKKASKIGNEVLRKNDLYVNKSKTLQKLLDKGYSDEEAKILNELNWDRCNNFKIDNWIKKGFSEEEAKNKIVEISKKGSQAGIKSKKENPNYFDNTQIGYYLAKGFSEEESKKLLSERQSTFTLEKCIKRHGEIEGAKKFNDRQIQWQNTLKELPNYQDIVKRRYCNSKFYSNESKILFDAIIENLPIDIICRYAEKEWYIYGNNRINFYDFTIPSLQIIIEYNGIAYHPNPNWPIEKLQLWKQLRTGTEYNEILEWDRIKNKVAEDAGYKVYTIFSDEDKEKFINYITEIIIDEYNRRKI